MLIELEVDQSLSVKMPSGKIFVLSSQETYDNKYVERIFVNRDIDNDDLYRDESIKTPNANIRKSEKVLGVINRANPNELDISPEYLHTLVNFKEL